MNSNATEEHCVGVLKDFPLKGLVRGDGGEVKSREGQGQNGALQEVRQSSKKSSSHLKSKGIYSYYTVILVVFISI